MEELAERHETFYFSSYDERKDLAKKVLDAVLKDEWCYSSNWVEKSCKLEKSDPQRIEEIASYNRFLMGLVVKNWLNTFITRKITYSQGYHPECPYMYWTDIDDNYCTYGPFIVDNLKVELFCDKLIPRGESEIYTERCKEGTVSVVLGAGNANFLSIIDVFERVFTHSECVMLKHHPLRPFLYKPYECILEPLISDNIVRMVYNMENNQKLIQNPYVGHIHFTGSEGTYKAISDSTCIDITGELGCATPWIILPGKWTKKEMNNAVIQIVNAKIANGGAYCMSPQVILLCDNWAQKNDFYFSLSEKIREKKPGGCYYPGAIRRKNLIQKRYEKYLSAYSISYPSQSKGFKQDDMVLFINLGILNGTNKYDDYILRNEAFCPVLACGFIECGDIQDYVKKVCEFVNSNKLCGSLSCTVLTPKSLESKYVDECKRELNYGTIAINMWSIFGYGAALSGGTWGAHYSDRRSGRGRNGNMFRIKNVTKTIISGQKLENPTIYMYDLPPKLITDLLYVINVHCSTFREKVYKTCCFLFNRLISNIYGQKPQYGSVL